MPRSRLGLIETVAALCLLLTACGGGNPTSIDSPSAAPSGTTSPPDSGPTEVSTAVPTPAAPTSPPAADTRAGRTAFARHVVAVWGAALSTNDVGPLLALSPKGRVCEGCRSLQTELRRRQDAGWHVDFPGATVKSVELARSAQQVTASMAISIPESDSFNDDGSYRGSSPAHPNARFEVRMSFTKAGFRLLSFTLTA